MVCRTGPASYFNGQQLLEAHREASPKCYATHHNTPERPLKAERGRREEHDPISSQSMGKAAALIQGFKDPGILELECSIVIIVLFLLFSR